MDVSCIFVGVGQEIEKNWLMKITAQTVDEFLRCLKAEPSGAVLQNVVRVSVAKRPMDGNSKRDAVKWQVTLQASAVVGIIEDGEEQGGQYLLQVGEECGVDYRDASQETPGTERADELRRMIQDYCDGHSLRVLPGTIDV